MSPQKWEKKKWKDFSGAQKVATILVGIVQLTLLVAAQVDIQKRAPQEINGNKNAWRLLAFVNFIGPIAYFLFGRKRTGFSTSRGTGIQLR
jgi:hypothetical protein